MAQFLSPDPFIQAPGNWYNYNRYGYCLNNPLIYTDPSGELWWLVGAFIGGAIANKSLNPLKWNFKEPTTWFGMIGGALLGQAAMGPGGWFASGGQGVNIALGANINNLVAPVAKFTASNSGLAFKGLGYVTAAGGGLWLASEMSNPAVNVERGLNQMRMQEGMRSDYFANHDRMIMETISYRINNDYQNASNNGYRSIIDNFQSFASAFEVYSDFTGDFTSLSKRFSSGTTVISFADHMVNGNYGDAFGDVAMASISRRLSYPIMFGSLAYSGVMETSYGTSRMSINAMQNWLNAVSIYEQNPSNWNYKKMERARNHMIEMRKRSNKYRR